MFIFSIISLAILSTVSFILLKLYALLSSLRSLKLIIGVVYFQNSQLLLEWYMSGASFNNSFIWSIILFSSGFSIDGTS